MLSGGDWGRRSGLKGFSIRVGVIENPHEAAEFDEAVGLYISIIVPATVRCGGNFMENVLLFTIAYFMY